MRVQLLLGCGPVLLLSLDLWLLSQKVCITHLYCVCARMFECACVCVCLGTVSPYFRGVCW